MTPVEIGTRVAYSREFLRNTGQYTGWAPFARGVVIGLHHASSFTLARLRWDGEEQPSNVNVNNLVREDHIHLEPR